MTAALALLPVGGAALVWVPAVIYLAATSQWGWALFLLIWGTFVSISDNLLRPLLISTHAPVSILAVFIGIIGGVSAFGMIGVIIGPVLLTLIAALLRFLDATLSHCINSITARTLLQCAPVAYASSHRATAHSG